MANLNTNAGAYISITQLLRLLEKKQEEIIATDIANNAFSDADEAREYWDENPLMITVKKNGRISFDNYDNTDIFNYETLDDLKAEILRSLQE